jgi:hypothetical protein
MGFYAVFSAEHSFVCLDFLACDYIDDDSTG